MKGTIDHMWLELIYHKYKIKLNSVGIVWGKEMVPPTIGDENRLNHDDQYQYLKKKFNE